MTKLNGFSFLERITDLRKKQDDVFTAASEVAAAVRKLSLKQKKANGKSTDAS